MILGTSEYIRDLNNVANNIRKIQTCAWNNTTANKPAVSGGSTSDYGISVYIPSPVSNFNFGIQIALKFDGSEMFIRTYWGTQGFQPWNRISIIT